MRFSVGFALLVVSGLLCTLLIAPSGARAESYEWQRMERVLRAHKLELAELAEDKRIAWIRVVSDDVFV
ncbi:MAG: hypothetical protein JWN04_1719 [Myxococcaceae bacterium]|nr:hypothetical protein [Myxococcaceae bacterium]